ncbi:hypothetical protein CX648_21500 [Aeromonas dhakensis]|nr:hypothetical protein CX648_21500 [Aeromonas dhakensis]
MQFLILVLALMRALYQIGLYLKIHIFFRQILIMLMVQQLRLWYLRVLILIKEILGSRILSVQYMMLLHWK